MEKEHEARYLKLLQNVEEGRVFVKDGEVYWQCLNCGAIVKASESARSLPCLCASAGVFPGEARELLIVPQNTCFFAGAVL